MGVTTYFFAFDPELCPGDPTVERLLEWGAIDLELAVQDDAAAWLKEIESLFNHNKRWNANIAADYAWDIARRYVDAHDREPIDRWLAHLFWDDEGSTCTFGQEPRPVSDSEVIYDAAYLDHILSLECSLLPVQAALEYAFFGDPPRHPHLYDPWSISFDGLCWLVHEWRQTLGRARQAGRSWSLLRWVWI